MRQSRAIHIIPEAEQDDRIVYKGIEFESTHEDVLDICLRRHDPSVAVVVPSYRDRNCFLSILARGAGTSSDLLIPENMAVGDHVTEEQDTSVLVFLPNGNNIVLFSYADRMKRRGISNLSARFGEIFTKVPEEVTKVYLIPFGCSNGYEFNRVSFIIHRDIRAAIDGFSEDSKIETVSICCPESLPAARVIKHLKHFNYMFNNNESACPICMECVGTSFYTACGHSSFCVSCLDLTSECAICRTAKTGSQRVPRATIGTGENSYVSECLCCIVKSDDEPTACKCGPNDSFTKLFFITE